MTYDLPVPIPQADNPYTSAILRSSWTILEILEVWIELLELWIGLAPTFSKSIKNFNISQIFPRDL